MFAIVVFTGRNTQHVILAEYVVCHSLDCDKDVLIVRIYKHLENSQWNKQSQRNIIYIKSIFWTILSSISSFAIWGTAFLDKWLSPGHYLYLMLQTLAGYQLYHYATNAGL